MGYGKLVASRRKAEICRLKHSGARYRPDNLQNASEAIRSLLAERANELGIVMCPCNKSYIRFYPKEWNQPGNSHGTGWGNSNCTVLFELYLSAKQPTLNVIAGKAPAEWIDALWLRSQSPPFQQALKKRTERPKEWVALHHAGKSKLLVGDEEPEDLGDIPSEIVKWCCRLLQDENTRGVIRIIADELPALDAHFRSQVS